MKNLDGIIERAELDTKKLYSMHLGTSNVLFLLIHVATENTSLLWAIFSVFGSGKDFLTNQ